MCGLGKGNIDSYNDETFGCAEYLDHETSEEERRRGKFPVCFLLPSIFNNAFFLSISRPPSANLEISTQFHLS